MRWKLIAGNVVALLIVGLLGWLVVRGQVADALSHDASGTVQRSVGLFDAVRTAEGDRFKSLVQEGASHDAARGIFADENTNDQRQRAYDFAQGYSRELSGYYPPARPRAADIVVVTGPDGHVLARNVNLNAESNRDLRTEFEVVDYALGGGGRLARDFVKYDGQRWYDVVVAPITSAAQGAAPSLRGLLLVGYEVADSIAQEDKARLGVDVGYLTRENNQFAVHSLSFGGQAEKDAILHWAGDSSANLASIFNGDGTLSPTTVTINGDDYVISARGMPGVLHPTRPNVIRPGFVVLQNVSSLRAPATPVTMWILYLMIAGLLLVVVYNTLMANYLLQPIEQIEEGLLRIINGDRDHRIEIQHTELGGIVYRINQLVSELTGAEEEADESGRISRPPPRPAPAQPTQPIIDENAIGAFNPAGNPADALLAQQLAAEPENEYYDRLRREYVAARQRAGLGADGLTHEQFVESVRSSEQALAQKYQLTLVRFQVQAQGPQQVVFRPVPIR